MNETIRPLRKGPLAFAALFGLASLFLMGYYLSDTLIHFTTNQQFPINSFQRFPLTFLIFPAELFSFCFALYFVYVIYQGQGAEEHSAPLHDRENTRVAILLPVYNEPKEIVHRTITSCKAVRWPGGTRIYILDDSSEEGDRRNMDELGREHGCVVVRRQGRTGYKAGNVENALRSAVEEPYFVIFDADQAPLPAFLELTMDHFSDPGVAFVQTPQYFVDERTPLERAAKVGTNIFYQAQCLGKSRDGALPFCGTNAVIRTSAYRLVGGFSYYTATEDIELGLRMNQAGYRGVYVPVVLAHGYAPPDFTAYASQQYRWANGNLAILRESWRSILFGNLSFRQQVHTLFTLGWWLVGLATLAYITVPILSLLLGMGTHHTWLPTTLLVLLYFNIGMGVTMIYASLRGRLKGERVTLGDAVLQYVLITNSAFIFARAALSALFKRYIGFVRTKKTRSASGWRQVKWNLLLSALCLSFSLFALYKGATAVTVEQLRTYLPISLWLLFYSLILGASIIFVGERPAREKNIAASASGTANEREVAP